MSYQHLRSCKRFAAKQHICIWCGEAILIGEQYHYEVGLAEGDFQAHPWHIECDADAKKNHFNDDTDEFEPCGNKRPTILKNYKPLAEELRAMAARKANFSPPILIAAAEKMEWYEKQYMDLIYEVGSIWPNESRHATAKRYIWEYENRWRHEGPVEEKK